jgi:ribosomal-protein-alanine N-acetyltransferase
VSEPTIISNHPWPPVAAGGPGVAQAWRPRAIGTPRLTLRALTPGDRAAFLEALEASLEHLRPWMPAPRDWGIEGGLPAYFDRSLERTQTNHQAGTGVRLFAFAASGALAGSFNLNNIVRGVGQFADAGWWVSLPAAGRGVATEGVNALLDLAFRPLPDGLGLHRVAAGIIPRNARSIRVAEKCGMRREGLARGLVRIAGVWEDHWVYAKTAEEA